MANPVPGREAVDNNDGTATTYYDDGSSVTWRIDTGQYVTSTPAPGAGLVGTVGTKPPQPSTWATYGNLTYSPQNNWYDPTTGRHTGWGSIGAGTQWTAPGWGVPGFGQQAIQISPQNWAVLSNPQQQQALAPGYIPGSGTYNQYNLANGGLFGNVAGVMSNLRYGQGGTGDPTTGLEAQTPQQIVNGPKLFNSTRTSNWGQGDQAGTGLDYIATLFLRPDTPSGINTAAWSAPDQYWAGLAQQIAAGTIQPTQEGWAVLAQKGYTPQKIGGAAPAQAAGAKSGSDSALQDYYATITANAQAMQAAQLAYQDWYMRTQDDEQAFQHAQQEYENKWNEQMFSYQKQKDQWALQQSAGYFEVDGQRTPTLAGIAQEAGLTGMYQGKPTFQREQYESGVMQNLLGLQAGLRGPENYAQYLKVLGSTPQGMRDVVNAAAGRFQMPSTTGMTPGQGTNAADVQSLLRDVTTGAPNAQADWSAALSGGLPAPNQISLQNWSKMMPTQQKMLLSAYEGAGWDTNDVLKQLQQSAPTGAVGGGTTGTFRF